MRLLIALLGIALTAVPVEARDLFVNNLSGYTVEAEILDAPNCEGPVFDDVTLQAFEKGLCVFHRPARSPEDTARAISLFDQAQIRGLPPVHQQFAALLTGLAQSSEAERHLNAYRASDNQDLLSRTFFCRDRRLAQAELNSIRWNHALFDYAEGLPSQRSLEARLTEMSAFYAGVLNAEFDAECGLITNLTETEINTFVDEAVAEVIETYFTGVESPITAMFARKLGRAEGLLETAEVSIAGLEKSAGVVNSEYEAFNKVYVEARDQKMGPIYDAYREAILRATSILDEFNRWKGGLFINSENVNLLPKISERTIEIQEELVRTQELAFRDKAKALTTDVRRIVNSEVENQATVGMICRIYFCELTARRSMPDVIRACRRPALVDNPLCVNQDGQMASGVLSVDFEGAQSISVEDLCRGAGVDPVFTTLNMGPTSAGTCLSVMP